MIHSWTDSGFGERGAKANTGMARLARTSVQGVAGVALTLRENWPLDELAAWVSGSQT